MQAEVLDLAGVGVGPFNLSLAALLAPHANAASFQHRFYERRPTFDWQSGMMLRNTRMQTSFLKDLVTPVDPTNRCSFLSYLVEKGRFYRFLNADFSRAMRMEFADYMRWASEQLPSLEFGAQVREVAFEDDNFVLRFDNRKSAHARHLVIGTGARPMVPAWAERHLGGVCFHSGGYMRNDMSMTGQRVLVVGGGQSGAEVFLDVCTASRGEPSSVTWVSRRPNLDPLDETAFANEYFTPQYVNAFHALPQARRAALVESHKLAGDGASPHSLREASQFLYEQDFLRSERLNYRIRTYRDVRAMSREHGAFRVEMYNAFDQQHETAVADVVILATGYRSALPECMGALGDQLERDRDGYLTLSPDYRARWSGSDQHRIYVQNGGRYSHGIADPQLSLAAHRSAVIVNSVMDRDVYRTHVAPTPVQWQSAHSEQPDLHRRGHSRWPAPV
jgi:lysine N6-hydroxylase